MRFMLFVFATLVFSSTHFDTAFAEDLRINLQWDHDGKAEDGATDVDIDYFRVAWDTKQGPPYANIDRTDGHATRGWALQLLNRTPGEILYFSVQACATTGHCSGWADEIAFVVVADTELPTVRPGRPINLMLVINAPVLVVPSPTP